MAVGVSDECSDDARSSAGFGRVGATGQNDRYAGAEHDASGQCIGEVFELLGQPQVYM